jgi:hypothetical protein
MIVLRKYKIAILCTIKTGTTVLRYIFTNPDAAAATDLFEFRHHWTIPQFKDRNPEIANEIDSYELYGFYRDPVERFVSFVNYNIRKYPDTIPADISYQEFVSEQGMLQHQAKWLDYPNMNLLDYRKFDFEVLKLMERCNLPMEAIPKLNVSVGGRTVADLSKKDYDFIKSCCARDYAFLASKGISLD